MDKLTELLLRSFDDQLSKEEQKSLDEGLAISEELRSEKESIIKMRQLLSNTDFKFDKGFADDVVENIMPAEKDFFIGFYNIFSRVALSGVAAIILFLVSIYFIDGSLNIETIQGIAEYTPGDEELSLLNIENLE